MTDLSLLSKASTALLLNADVSDIYVDLSRERTSLDDLTTYIEEAPSARTALDTPRSVSVIANLVSGSSGVLVFHGGAGSYGYRVRINAGVIECAAGGALKISATVPGLTGSEQRVLVHWAERTYGANSRSELALYNFGTDEWEVVGATHSAVTPSASDALVIGAAHAGGSPFSGTIDDVKLVRIDRRFVSTTEAARDFVAAGSPPTLAGERRTPFITGPAESLEIVEDGNLAGPSYLLAGAATRQADHRLVGPFVNVVINDPHFEQVTADPPQWYRATPDNAAGWQLCIRYLWHGYLSPQVNVAHVRAHIRVAEGDSGENTSPVRFRVYSLAHLFDAKPLVWHRTAAHSITAPNGGGAWVDLGELKLDREPSGLSYIALGFLIDATKDEGTEYDTGWRLQAITVEPYSRDLGVGVGDAQGA